MKYDPKMRRKRRSVAVLCVVLAVILVVLVGTMIWFENLLGGINRLGEEETLSEEQLASIYDSRLHGDDAQLPHGAAELIESGDEITNILLVGQDRRPGESRQRSDAMILCTIDKRDKTLTMTSFMRDMYVKIPGYWDDRINAAYQIGGFKTLNATLEYNFGVSVDYNVEVDFDGFQKIIDLMGGVDIELTAEEATYMNQQGAWELQEGVNHLNGYQALLYSRNRAIGYDYARTGRQRIVLEALENKTKDSGLMQMYQLAKGIIPLITTDMQTQQIMGLIVNMFPMLSDLEVKNQRIPANGAFSEEVVDGMQVLIPDFEANRAILKETIG